MEAEQLTEGGGISTEQPLQMRHSRASRTRRRFWCANEPTDAESERSRAMRSLTCHNVRASSSCIFSDALKYDISPSNGMLFRWQAARAAEAVDYECD